MACRCAPALVAMRDELNAAHPDRAKASDGCCGDAAHAARESDHNPDAQGWATALDITHDPAHGVDCSALVGQLVDRRDGRVKYLIWRRRIWRSYDRRSRSRPFLPAWEPELYTGPNPHSRHAHVSIVAAARYDTRPWFEEDDMTPEQARMLREVHRELCDTKREGNAWWLLRRVHHQLLVPNDPTTIAGRLRQLVGK